MLDRQGTQPNSIFVLNLLDYLNGREGFAVMRGKAAMFSPLKEVSPETRGFVKMFNVVGLPVLVAVAGVLVWLSWNSRKRRIREMFAARTAGAGRSAKAGEDDEGEGVAE